MPEPKKPREKPAADTRTQQQRFEDFAREHGATKEVLDKALRAPAVKQKPKES